MLGLFKRTPKLTAEFRPTHAVARELAREIDVAGELVLRNEGRDAELSDLELVFIGGGTRRIDLPPDAGATDLKRQRHLLEEADVILVMTEEQRRMLAAFPEAAGKPVMTVRELAGESGDIADPAMQDEDVFRHCRDEITRCLVRGLERLLAA